MARSEKAHNITIRCPVCLESAHLALSPADPRPPCPHCERVLPLDRPTEIAEEDFSSTVLGSELPVLVDFYAVWCGPCRWLVPILDDLARRWQGRVLVVKLDTDRAPAVASRYGIRSIPSVILFRDGEEVGRSVGVEPDVLNDLLEDVA